MSVERQLLMAASGVSTQYTIAKSLRFRSSASAYLNRTPSVAGNRQTWTWSGWVKRGSLQTSTRQTIFSASDGTLQNYTEICFETDLFRLLNFTANVKDLDRTSTSVYRDPSAWYHIVLAFDTTQAVATNRQRVYVNGVEVTAWTNATQMAQNANGWVNSTQPHRIALLNGFTSYFDGYMAEVNFVDGQALTPSSFGETSSTTGVWIPKQYSGTYGTNGFYLKFTDTTSTTTLGNDSSGNGNNWTPNNISLTTGATYDSMLDSPTNYDNGGNGVGNYAVLNPLSNPNGPIYTVSSANLNYSCPASSGNAPKMAVTNSIGVSTGKWYCEATETSSNCAFGITSGLVSGGTSNGPQYAIAYNGGTFSSTATYSGTSPTFVSGDIIGFAFDASAKTLAIYKNGTLLGSFSGLESSVTNWFFLQTVLTGAAATSSVWNFGQRPFAYTPPSGYKALNTQNLPTPSIVNGASYMAATTYTGTGASLSVSGAAFQPDLVWIKSRSAATDHALYDVIRGTQNRLESNTTDAAVAADNGLTAFGSSGFTVNTLAQVNTNAATYVGWQWKAGGTAVTNTAGSITSSVSANTTSGFSVVTYTGNGVAGATIGHGLGVAPSMVIFKSRSQSTSWTTYHSSVGVNSYMILNTTDAATSSSNWIALSSSVITQNTTGSSVNTNGYTYVAYCFAAIPGYSAFGSYTGNGSADGPFVYTGMRPRYVMLKRTDAAYSWFEYDTSRDTYNVTSAYLIANGAQAEQSYGGLDILSNGFKLRGSVADLNASGGNYIYACFAENPFQNARAR